MSGLDRDDIIRMAREVADKDKVDPVHNDMVTLTVDELGRLLAAEREACAALCDDMVLYTGFDCAAAIRAKGRG